VTGRLQSSNKFLLESIFGRPLLVSPPTQRVLDVCTVQRFIYSFASDLARGLRKEDFAGVCSRPQLAVCHNKNRTRPSCRQAWRL